MRSIFYSPVTLTVKTQVQKPGRSDGTGPADLSLSTSAAGSVSLPSVTQNNSNISAPVNIHVHASGMSAEAIGQGIYDTAERYLLRTLEHA